MQYEQLIETFENIFKVPSDLVRPPSEVSHSLAVVVGGSSDILKPLNDDFDQNIGTFEIDDKFKRRLFTNSSVDSGVNAGNITDIQKTFMRPKVSFELPTFIIQLKNEINNPLIEVSFRDFKVNYEPKNLYETSIQVSKFFIFFVFQTIHISFFLGFFAFAPYGRFTSASRFKTSIYGNFFFTRR